ncbi:MAG: response regulator transcription factor [Flavobacteriaceae bacterium]|nr:response regulator transcription factor [Bacteroidia bacterium]NNK88031.1 response regulator transcription factor [Flavobacteriaceae bacterium]
MKPTTILLAEDEPALGQIIKESLETRNFAVILCKNGKEAYEQYKKHSPELLVLDVMMPVKDGFSLAKEIRLEDNVIPIIFLTAKSQTRDVVEGFTIGGNDYLKKPFSMEELIARIHNLLDRRKINKEAAELKFGDFKFNVKQQWLQHGANPKEQLTHREAQLLFHLIQTRNEVLDRSLILNKLWGNDDFFSARSMDVYITKLRKKIKADESVRIVNVRGFGYKLIC